MKNVQFSLEYLSVNTAKHVDWHNFKLEKIEPHNDAEGEHAIFYDQCCTFLDHFLGQSVLETFLFLHRTWCSDGAEPVGHQTCRKQNPWL